MMPRRPAIVDTNVVVSGLLTSNPDAPTRRVLDGMLAGTFPFLISVELLAEYREVLLRPAIRARHGLNEEEIDSLLTSLAKEAMIREAAPSVGAPDAGDQHLWDLLGTHAQALLITGDHRLATEAPAKASVLSPAAFIRLIGPADR